MNEISRRSFLKGSAALAGATLLSSIGMTVSADNAKAEEKKPQGKSSTDQKGASADNTELKTDFQNVSLIISDEMADLMEERGIREEDVREVLAFAETTGNKLYMEDEEHFLARKRIDNFTAYVEYAVKEDAIELLDVYSHVIVFVDDVLEKQGE